MRLIYGLLFIVLFPALAWAWWPKLVRKDDGKIKIEYVETVAFYFDARCYPEPVRRERYPNGDWIIETVIDRKGCEEVKKNPRGNL